MKIVSPSFEERIKDLPPEKQEEARKGFEQFASGVIQVLLGNVRRAFVDRFLDSIGPAEKIQFEVVADYIVEAKNSNRLRQKTLIGLTAAFEIGVRYAVEASRRGENPLDKLQAIHKLVLNDETEKTIVERKTKRK